jgi:ABC-type multidrug transport system fused ATPase/permease subunit
VDMKTEAVIMDAIERLMEGRTSLMVAHRLSTLEICPARIEIEDGRLVSGDGATLTVPERGRRERLEALA